MVDLLTVLNTIRCAGGSCLQEEVEATECCFRAETTVSAGMELIVPSSRH